MFQEGTLIYFTPFYFKNGNKSKPKYFIVLNNDNEKAVLASLPTSRDYIPAKDTIKDGCVELPEINLNCFVISEETLVTKEGMHFDFPTHIYGHQLDTYGIDFLNSLYKIEEVDYTVCGTIEDSLFAQLLDCLRNSKSVKRKYKRILG
jgi:hypothetical protein